jgi:hypothetical protein
VRACSSPLGPAPERLPYDEAAAEAGIRRRRRKLGFWLRRRTAGKGGGSGGGVQGAAGGLNSPEGSLGVRATHRRRAVGGLGGGGAGLGRVRVEHGEVEGMTGGTPLSAIAAQRGRRGSGLARHGPEGQLGRAAAARLACAAGSGRWAEGGPQRGLGCSGCLGRGYCCCGLLGQKG